MWTIKWTFVLIFGGFVGFVMSQEFADQSSDFLDKRNNENDTGLDNAESLPELYEPFQENFEDNPANKGELYVYFLFEIFFF